MIEPPEYRRARTRRIARTILSLLAGSALITLLAIATDALLIWLMPARFDTHGRSADTLVLAIYICCGAAFGMAAGTLAARIAGRAEVVHVLVLAAMQAAVSLSAVQTATIATPVWYAPVLIGLQAVAIVTGGWIVSRRKRALEPALAPEGVQVRGAG